MRRSDPGGRIRVLLAGVAGIVTLVPLAQPASAAVPYDGQVLNCAVEALPLTSTASARKLCFKWFNEAMWWASYNTVDANAYQYSPDRAVTDPAFEEKVNAVTGNRRILSIEYDHAEWRGYALIVFSDVGACRPGTELKVDDLGRIDPYGKHWWTDRIGSYKPFSGCDTEHFDDSRAGTWMGGIPQASNMKPKHSNRTNSLRLHGGLSAQQADTDCARIGSRCTFIPNPGTAKTELRYPGTVAASVPNCSPSENLTRYIEYDVVKFHTIFTYSPEFSASGESTQGVTNFGKVDATTGHLFQEPSVNTESGAGFAGERTVGPERIGYNMEYVEANVIDGMWQLNYATRKYYQNTWYIPVTVSMPVRNSPSSSVYWSRPMTAAEKAACGTTMP